MNELIVRFLTNESIVQVGVILLLFPFVAIYILREWLR